MPSRLIGTGQDATFGFVGRDAEMADVEQARKEAVAGSQLRLDFVGGEPGIGKTSVARQSALRAHEAGTSVTFGACEEGLGVPFHPWIPALSHLVEHGRDLAGLRPAHAGALRRLLPHLSERFPDDPALTADPDAERYLLLEAVAALLATTAEPDGTLVVLDDLQWADTASLQLLGHLVRSAVPMKVLILATFRPGDLGRGHPLAGLLADLRPDNRVRRHDLAGLPDSDVLGLIEGAAGHRMDETGLAVAQAVHRETGGNPFFVVEILRHLAESDAIVQDGSGQYALRGSLADFSLPSSVREVVGRRVSRLSEDAVRVLSVAAVIGQEFDLEVLASVSEADEDVLLDLLDAAGSAALVRELDDPPGRYRFSHALVQSSLYADLSPARRQRLHQRVADHLESVHGGAAATALHYLAAIRPADVGKAVTYATRAGDEALAALAPLDAAAWYGRALDALERGGQPDIGRQAELLVAQANAQSWAGDAAFRSTLADAVGPVLATGDVDLLVRAALVRLPGSMSSPQSPTPRRSI